MRLSRPVMRNTNRGRPGLVLTGRRLQWMNRSSTAQPMSKIDELAERVERLLVRHVELQRTNVLLQQQLGTVAQDRDTLRARLSAARGRIDALLERLPAEAGSSDKAEGTP
jgi:cell division protein ZapB